MFRQISSTSDADKIFLNKKNKKVKAFKNLEC